MNRILILTLGLALLLCGCPKRQAYEQPAPPVPAAWPEPAAGAAATGSGVPAAADLGWREFFTDPKLQSVIGRALEHNRDLRIAALNVDKVQALYRIQRAAQYPTVSAAAAIDAYRVPKNLSDADESKTVVQYTLSLGATAWEIDFFGRIRSLKEQALEQYLATEQARSAVQISLVAAVAASYLTLAADQENLRLARATLDAQQKSYELIRSSRDFGIASDLDVHEAQSLVEAARVDIARYNGLIAWTGTRSTWWWARRCRPTSSPPSSTRWPTSGMWPPDCPPTCCSAGPTSARPSTSCGAPTPTSRRRARRSSRGSP